MGETIFEIQKEKPGIQPVQVSTRSGLDPKIENLGGSSYDPEPVTVLDSTPSHHEITVGQPLTEDDKARAVMNPFEAKTPEEPKQESITDVPGVTEVPLAKEQPYKDQQIILTDGAKKIENIDFGQLYKNIVSGDMIDKLIKRFELQGIDIQAEKEKIDQKVSCLSRSKREAVVALWNMKQLQRKTLFEIAKPMVKKESASNDEINQLLDQVEQDATEYENAAKIVSHNIVQRAIENNIPKQEVPANVEEAMEAAKVDYTPGEGGNKEYVDFQEDEITAKALHDAVKNHGRTKFRGVFDSLDQVENPKVGDVVHTIISDDKGNHSGEELVYTYIGPNHWKLEGSRIQEELPGPVPEEKKPDLSKSMNDFVVRG